MLSSSGVEDLKKTPAIAFGIDVADNIYIFLLTDTDGVCGLVEAVFFIPFVDFPLLQSATTIDLWGIFPCFLPT